MAKVRTVEERLDAIESALTTLVRLSGDQFEELIEKINNLNLGGQDYSTLDLDDFPND